MSEYDEEAERILFEKYTILIKYRVHRFKVKERYVDDFIQEGLFMLLIAIRTYNEFSNKTFTKYFDLILQRKFRRLMEQDKNYFYNVDLIEDDNILQEPCVFVYEYNNDSLSELEEKVLKMKRKNYRPKEIAETLKCDVKSIYNCLYRIRNKENRKQ